MPVSPDVLSAARKYSTSATTSLLASYYPVAHRIAYALCGDPKVADRVIEQVMRRALLVLPRWRDETLPDRWFYHHTVLACRAVPASPPAADDALIPAVAAAPYVAFIRTLRSLPPQQREAVVLHFGERLNDRFLGIAMDCSADAAAAHYLAADNALRRMAGDAFEGLTKELAHAYKVLAPSVPAVEGLRTRVAHFVWPRLLWRWVRRGVILIVLSASALIAWHYSYLIHLRPTSGP